MAIRTDGIISGLSTTALVQELSKAASSQRRFLKQRISQLNAKNTAYSTLNTLMTAVKDFVDRYTKSDKLFVLSPRLSRLLPLVISLLPQVVVRLRVHILCRLHRWPKQICTF